MGKRITRRQVGPGTDAVAVHFVQSPGAGSLHEVYHKVWVRKQGQWGLDREAIRYADARLGLALCPSKREARDA